MKSSSLKMAMECGIQEPAKYRDALIHEWYLNPLYAEKLVMFTLLKITSKELELRIDKGELYIGDKQYSITWIDTPQAVYESKSKYALISFRFCKYLNTGYALVKVLKGDHTEFNAVEHKG